MGSAPSAAALSGALPGREGLVGWDVRAGALEQAWGAGDRLRWIHWCGAGVDAALFPALAASEVTLTNARGVFDVAMAEYVLGLVLALAKGFPETFAAQRERRWSYRLGERVAGRRALIVGVGAIGRAIARALGALGIEVHGIGRHPRDHDADFTKVYPPSALHAQLGRADFVVAILPATAEAAGLFAAAEFAAMPRGARFINVGRGSSVDEAALVAALASGHLGGAALDVFADEPLDAASPLWDAPGLIVSPHMSGDYHGHDRALLDLFADNLRRYRAGDPLANVVDKRLGYVRRD